MAKPTGLDRLGVSAEDRAFLVDPLEGYPLVVDATAAAEVRRLYETLIATGDTGAANLGAVTLLEGDPGFHPARVLAAQVYFLERRHDEARRELSPVTSELPQYNAAQLLSGRVAEALGEVPEAYAAYRAAAPSLPVAAERAEFLKIRALEIVGHRLDDALGRERPDQAAAALAWLQTWAPEADVTLEAAWKVASAGEDPAAERVALSALLARRPGERDLLLRLSDLEFQAGQARRGVEILRRLVEAHPQDPELAERLDEGKLRFRVSLLPGEVQALAQRTELDRGDYALLLYWLMPGVRSGRGGTPRIAADILEHPHQDAIARVINQRLMDVDETLHRFSPERPVSRLDALESLLRFLGQGGDEAGLPACLGPRANPHPSLEWICSTAARCRLIQEEAECLPRAPVSGAGALDLMRRALRQVGGA